MTSRRNCLQTPWTRITTRRRAGHEEVSDQYHGCRHHDRIGRGSTDRLGATADVVAEVAAVDADDEAKEHGLGQAAEEILRKKEVVIPYMNVDSGTPSAIDDMSNAVIIATDSVAMTRSGNPTAVASIRGWHR